MPPVDPWEKLYRKVGQERAQAQDRARLADEANTDFEKWCAGKSSEVMHAIRDRAVERAEQFERETGATIAVTYPAQAPNAHIAQLAPEMLFLKLSLEQAVLHLYAARAVAKLPTFHVLSAVDQLRPAAARRPRESVRPTPATDRVVSQPVCRLVRSADGQCSLQEPGSNGRGAPVDADMVVFKAFEVLVGHWRKLRK